MSADEMSPLWPDIISCLEKYVARFPDETVSNIIAQCASGRRQLWIIQDEVGRVILTPITEITADDATGAKTLVLAEVGGSRLREAMPCLKEIESWAKRKHGATKARLIGRDGWMRLLPRYGYQPEARIYSKGL
ncbi:hypothetical protein DKP76_11490 [Falsochrobactrum shanghaiense]|uniref:GNAT family N-acetyltransferase n=1 Tax=Falsochrobactrum shanghaiense TaxID=2201899 RepID=A0A316J6S2_9HYPH|nr:hypothetical protein [Falsochrobactrum shanghaiense]PWL17394.1 hypothetical protein DKP76_11490 [Falsochrobactrum shanghaiense]